MRAPFGLAEAEELRRLIAAAGFGNITIRSVLGTVRFPSVERFVQDYVAGSPLAAHVAKVSDEARAALIREVGDTLKSYVAGGTLTFPIAAPPNSTPTMDQRLRARPRVPHHAPSGAGRG